MSCFITFDAIKTRWFWLGYAFRDEKLIELQLGAQRVGVLAEHFESKYPGAKRLKGIAPDFTDQVQAYFAGEAVSFSIDWDLSGLSVLAGEVLTRCAAIPLGETMTYGALAQAVGHPRAARAVGSIMAGNPIPLIIPCHRVLRSDGGLGGYSAPGGPHLKKMLLQHEQEMLVATHV